MRLTKRSFFLAAAFERRLIFFRSFPLKKSLMIPHLLHLVTMIDRVFACTPARVSLAPFCLVRENVFR